MVNNKCFECGKEIRYNDNSFSVVEWHKNRKDKHYNFCSKKCMNTFYELYKFKGSVRLKQEVNNE